MFSRYLVIVSGQAREDLPTTSFRHMHVSAALRLAVLVLVTSIAFADDETTKTEGRRSAPSTPTFHQTVTVLAQPVEATGAALSEVERAEIASSGVTTLGEVLRQVSGLHVTESGSRGGVTTVEIRGGDPTHTLVLLDGIPLNDGTSALGDVCDLASLTADEVDRIEIMRGPVSSLYGSRALAGVVQVFSRRVRGEGTHGDARADVGRFDLRRLGGSLGSSSNARGGIVSVGWEKEHGRVGDDRFSGLDLRGQADLPLLGRELRLNTRFGHRTTDDYPDASGGPLLGDGMLRHSEGDELSLSINWTGDVSAARRQTVDAAVFHRVLDRDSPAIAPIVPSSMEATRMTRSRLGWSGTFSLSQGLRLQSGLDIEHEQGTNDSLLSLGPEVQISGDYTMERKTMGAFAGLAGHAGSFASDLTLRIDAIEGHATQANPRASLSFAPREAIWRLRASLGRGFKLPSFYALASPRAIGGNPDLRSETSVGGDLGIDLKSGPASASLSLFQSRYRDLIDFDFGVMRLVNRARVTSRGVEASLSWSPFSTLSLSSSLTHLKSSDADSDEPILHQPAWTIDAALGWAPSEKVRMRLDVHGVSRAFDRQIPAPKRDHVAGHAVLGSVFSWRLAPLWRIVARCDNLADSRYETLIGFPGPRRALRVGLRFGGE